MGGYLASALFFASPAFFVLAGVFRRLYVRSLNDRARSGGGQGTPAGPGVTSNHQDRQ